MRLEGFVDVGEILCSGVYALVHRRQVVYVGKSKNMLTRIYSHRHVYGDRRGKRKQFPSWYPIKGILFDRVWVRPCPLDQMDSLEREMIARYRPRYNILLVPPRPLPVAVMAQLLRRDEQPPAFVRRV